MTKKLKVIIITVITLLLFLAQSFAQEPDWIRKKKEENKRKLPELIEKLRKAKTTSDLGEMLIWDIGETGDPRIVEPLIEVIESDDTSKFRNIHYVDAANFLGKMGDKRAIPALKNRLPKEKDSKNRYHQSIAIGVAIALCQLGELHTALPVMREFINKEYIEYNDSPKGNRPYNIEDIVNIPIDVYKHDTTAVRLIYDFFRDATKNNDELLRAGAADKLVNTDSKLAFKTATEVLSEDTVGKPVGIIFPAKQHALQILGKIGDGASIKILKEFIKYPDRDLSYVAQLALRQAKKGKDK